MSDESNNSAFDPDLEAVYDEANASVEEGKSDKPANEAFVSVRNLDLATCLLAVGVPLHETPPYTHKKYASGKVEWTFNFQLRTSDGEESTYDLVRYFDNSLKFIAENPQHPMTYAMCAVKNRQNLLLHMKDHTPYVAMRAPASQSILHVIEGSNKHKQCQGEGYTQM